MAVTLERWNEKFRVYILFMNIDNIFASVSTHTEVFEKLLSTSHFTLERIVSTGQATPSSEWYDQEKEEWVILLSGSAGLLFETKNTVQVLHPGDYVHIPAHQRHRVEWTDSSQPTVWLALHFQNEKV
ncbi:cupin domain-containing protein [Thiotrichales bacterium HSG14]|nr:cupin domain-containing protein [Thiotrichales bacterium HSG14]